MPVSKKLKTTEHRDMKNVRSFLFLPLLLAILAGCRLFTDTATLVVENRSSFTIDEVYITPHNALWGDDLLAETIPPGESLTFRWIAPGTYDILVWDAGDGWSAWVGEYLAPWEKHTITHPY
jgi:hypothetical protein